jgi:hypothetical protein
MHITLEPTTAHLNVQPSNPDGTFSARVWVGTLDDGHVVQALIFQVSAPQHPDQEALALRLAHEVQRAPQKLAWDVDPEPTLEVI